ncbi:FAD-binding oxidoreductase [Thauera sinica]|uniref:FAD-binding oxidoreductase n=1 Tax=Thauera sinica TaxID=2665146 RepID=A0ABW1ALX0_9RHOO|nr:FAD-binding oxidoreductase [Thauera sp. K11]ATE59252.1 hydroxyacid dehydrogenase [Thauera sp. K11]
MNAFLQRLVGAVGRAAVVTAPADMAPHLQDWRGRYRGAALAVVRPASTDEVAAVVRICAEEGVPIVPQGGNTGLCGGATPLADGRSVVVSLSRMNRIRSVDADNAALCVEAGCTLAEVQAAASAVGRFFPLSLASEGSCQIGGNLSTNAGGVQVLRYGNARDLALGLEVVLPDGRVWDGLRALRKDNTGYDLKHLFIGAEGTLGIITAAVLKLFPAPDQSRIAWAAVPDAAAAVALLGRLREDCGDRITAFEIIGREALELVLRHIPGARPPLPDSGPWAVLIEAADRLRGGALEDAFDGALADAVAAGVARDVVVAGTLAQARALWSLRDNISEAQRIEGISIKHDISVPVSRIPAFLEQADAALRAVWPDVRIVAFGHIGDGNLHYNLSKSAAQDNPEFIASTPRVNAIVHDLVVRLGGSISAEHGLGQLKRDEIRRYKSAVELDMMMAVKRAFDPRGLMNPGKVIGFDKD